MRAKLIELYGVIASKHCGTSTNAARSRAAFDSSQFFSFAEPCPSVITAKGDQLSIGGDILNDATVKSPQIVAVRVHKVHARDEDAIKPSATNLLTFPLSYPPMHPCCATYAGM